LRLKLAKLQTAGFDAAPHSAAHNDGREEIVMIKKDYYVLLSMT
jgi:hypothetical protein